MQGELSDQQRNSSISSPASPVESDPFSFCSRGDKLWGLHACALYYDLGNATSYNIRTILFLTTMRAYRASYEKTKGIAPPGVDCIWMIDECPVSLANQAMLHLTQIDEQGHAALIVTNELQDLHSMAVLWLHRKHQVEITNAITEVEAHLIAQHIQPQCSLNRLLQLLASSRVCCVNPFHPQTHIHFVRTGGTIDKGYPRMTRGYAFEMSDPAVEKMMRRLPHNFLWHLTDVCAKDSLELTKEDRFRMVEVCRESTHRCIVCTHGTDGMLATASVLASAELNDKVIVLTGAFQPEAFKESDADFNLGASIAAVRLLAPGVYVCMNGEVVPWFATTRDIGSGRFINAFDPACAEAL